MPDKHLSTQFDSELTAISAKVMELGGLVESQTLHAILALSQFDTEIAQGVRRNETRVNEMEVEIDRDLSSIIARRQPTARDLRLLIAISKTVILPPINSSPKASKAWFPARDHYRVSFIKWSADSKPPSVIAAPKIYRPYKKSPSSAA